SSTSGRVGRLLPALRGGTGAADRQDDHRERLAGYDPGHPGGDWLALPLFYRRHGDDSSLLRPSGELPALCARGEDRPVHPPGAPAGRFCALYCQFPNRLPLRGEARAYGMSEARECGWSEPTEGLCPTCLRTVPATVQEE